MNENSIIQTSKRENFSDSKTVVSGFIKENDISRADVKNINFNEFENNNSNDNKKCFIQMNNNNSNNSRNKNTKKILYNQLSFGNFNQNLIQNNSSNNNNNIKENLQIEDNKKEKEDNKNNKLEKGIKTKLSNEKFMMKLRESEEFNKKKSLNESNSFIEKVIKENKKKWRKKKQLQNLKDDLIINQKIEIYNNEKDNNLISQENKKEDILEQQINKEEKEQNISSKKTKEQKIKEKIEKRLEYYKKNKNNISNNDNKKIPEGIESIESKINKNKFRPIEKSYTINDKAKIIQNLMLGKNKNYEPNQIVETKENNDINNLISQKPVIKKKKKTYKPFIISD